MHVILHTPYEKLDSAVENLNYLIQIQSCKSNDGVLKFNAIFHSLVDPKKGYWSLVKKFCHTTTVQMVQSHHDATDQIKRGMQVSHWKPHILIFFLCPGSNL